jgi:3-phosphoshikimate 1-carboxyvinyltransferase
MNQNDSITLFPSTLNGEINVPTSKSLTHRALICAALSRGKSTITNVVFSEDILATLNAIEQLGAKYVKSDTSVTIKGVKALKAPQKPLDCNESGSTLRFLIPIVSLSNKEVVLTGKPSLLSRPQTVYETLFNEDNIPFKHTSESIVVNGSIKAREYYIDGTISSQFFTGLMFSLPLLEEDSHIHIKGPLESKGYIDLTIDILNHFGVTINEISGGYHIPGKQTYQATDYEVEGDYSQAAFFLVGGILSGSVAVTNLHHESLQGDRAIIDIIKQMKGRLMYLENGFNTTKSQTYSTKIDVSDCPDLGPIVALLAALSKGTTKIVNAGRLRLKESDRIHSTCTTLEKLGATIKTDGDDIIIHGKNTLEGGVTLDSFNDHRIAMMIAIAATVTKKPVTLTRPFSVNKSYPHFFQDYTSLGGSFH